MASTGNFDSGAGLAGAGSGAAIGASIGSIVPGAGTAIGAGIGAGIGFLAGGFIGGDVNAKQKAAQEEAFRQAEKVRIGGVLREFGKQQQAASIVASGFKKSEGGKSSKTTGVIPDPIADTSGFIGGGVPNTPANGSRTSGDF